MIILKRLSEKKCFIGDRKFGKWSGKKVTLNYEKSISGRDNYQLGDASCVDKKIGNIKAAHSILVYWLLWITNCG